MPDSADIQPFERFRAIDAALQGRRGWFESVVYLRFAAMAGLACDGAPEAIAAETRAISGALRKRAGWFGALRSELRYVVAAGLLASGDNAAAFDAEMRRARTLFREAGLRRDAAYET
ncbi:MAG: hypothetical protein KDA32_11760, partial [Phycisphaerales bacterium]|nr:hypothetical protein [Phycisphaerales bacterium]